jgi:hypothetical protein
MALRNPIGSTGRALARMQPPLHHMGRSGLAPEHLHRMVLWVRTAARPSARVHPLAPAHEHHLDDHGRGAASDRVAQGRALEHDDDEHHLFARDPVDGRGGERGARGYIETEDG